MRCVHGQLLSSNGAAVLTLTLTLALALVGVPAQAASKPFWTPDTMRAAVPMDNLVKAPAFTPKDVERGQSAIRSIPNGGGAWTGGGQVTHTAGHCVKYQGTWHTQWTFVPGYDNGNAPYGQWAAKTTLTTPQWEAGEDMNYDVGMAVVNPPDEQRLTDVVGAGIAFNQPKNQSMYTFGYPAAAPYDGTGAGVQASVNSFGYTFLPGCMFGPYFGADAQNLYNRAQAA